MPPAFFCLVEAIGDLFSANSIQLAAIRIQLPTTCVPVSCLPVPSFPVSRNQQSACSNPQSATSYLFTCFP